MFHEGTTHSNEPVEYNTLSPHDGDVVILYPPLGSWYCAVFYSSMVVKSVVLLKKPPHISYEHDVRRVVEVLELSRKNCVRRVGVIQYLR